MFHSWLLAVESKKSMYLGRFSGICSWVFPFLVTFYFYSFLFTPFVHKYVYSLVLHLKLQKRGDFSVISNSNSSTVAVKYPYFYLSTECKYFCYLCWQRASCTPNKCSIKPTWECPKKNRSYCQRVYFEKSTTWAISNEITVISNAY